MEHLVKMKRRRAHTFNDVQELPEQTCLLDLDLHSKVKSLDMEIF
jgi:hypothetical protein